MKQLAPGVIAEIAEPEIRKELPSSSCKTAYLEKWNRSSYSRNRDVKVHAKQRVPPIALILCSRVWQRSLAFVFLVQAFQFVP
jgi:hypothetical protein